MDRFQKVDNLVGGWSNPCAVSDLKKFCESSGELADSLRKIVPKDMHKRTGLENENWVDNIAGPESRFAYVEREVCADCTEMKRLRKEYFKQHKDVDRIGKRMKTIANESTLLFLSRKAVIPKYGFPVDVVELDTRPRDDNRTGVALQRDLSQAIAEYAPGGKVVANKLEYESCGVKVIPGKAWPVRHYQYNDARNFKQWNENDLSKSKNAQKYPKYLIPEFGFVTPLFKKPKEPRGRTQRLYTTRPFFRGFDIQPETKTILGVQVTKASPGTLVILCEGKNKKGFYICRSCGYSHEKPSNKHDSPSGSKCTGTLERFSLGHELVTDVVRLQFPNLTGEWDAYSVAYAILLGAAGTLGVPNADLNVTITDGNSPGESAIVLYDNVPGGAGLVAQLEEQESVFKKMINKSRQRVQGNCGCDSSCYGCLRSYRNQFAHPHLNRKQALEILDAVTCNAE